MEAKSEPRPRTKLPVGEYNPRFDNNLRISEFRHVLFVCGIHGSVIIDFSLIVPECGILIEFSCHGCDGRTHDSMIR